MLNKVWAAGTALVAACMITLAAPTGACGYELFTWGTNEDGQLGNGSLPTGNEFEFAPNIVPAPVLGLGEVSSAATAPGHTLALLTNGNVMAWGANNDGQLGNGTTTGPYECGFPVLYCNPTPEPVLNASGAGVSGVSAVAAGGEAQYYGEYSLALLENGTLLGWGENTAGELGNGTTTGSDTAIAAGSGLSNIRAIAARGYSAYALLASGQVMAWGSSREGGLGDGQERGSTVPVPVKGLTDAIAIQPQIALLETHTVVDWGAGQDGTLGDGETSKSDIPVSVAGVSSVSAVAAGEKFNLALRENGTVWGWGENNYGQLGRPSGPETCGDVACSKTPIEVPGLSNVKAIAAAGAQAYALLDNGTVVTWGDNQDTPVSVCGLQEISGIAATYGWALAYGPPHEMCPTVTAISPANGPTIGKTHVTITGTNFTGATAVHFGSTKARFTVESSTTIIAIAPATADTAGDVPITVTTSAGTSPVAPGDQYLYEYGPAVTRVAPHQGPPEGGTPVKIIGANFTKVTAVDFGDNPATKFKTESADLIIATAPPGAGTLQVTVINGEGASPVTSETRFTYTPPQAPEFGVCKKDKNGRFADAACTDQVTQDGTYEWTPGTSKTRFKIKSTQPVSFTVSEYLVIECASMSGTGELAGTKEIAGTTLTFKHCLNRETSCSSPGETDITEHEVEGILGWQNKANQEVALALGIEMLGAGGEFEIMCLGARVAITGSVLAPVKADTTLSSLQLEYYDASTTQGVERFEGGPLQQLMLKFIEPPGEHSTLPVGLSMTATLRGIKLEINTIT